MSEVERDAVEMARTICFAWGHCAGGCQFKGAMCLGDADSLLHGWQGRCANAALARLIAEKDAELAAARDKALEDAAQCCEREADRCDDAAIWGGSRTYVNNCKAAAYAMRDRANAIRALGNAAAAALAVEKKRADDATLTAGDEE